MNLVAKEFVAAQDPKDPGVLIISPMAGAARELTGALQVNPYDKRAVAQALDRALHMSLDERRERHHRMLESLKANDIHNWYGTFCRDLDDIGLSPAELRFKVRADARHVTASENWWRRTVGRFFNSRAS
jgi:trehalose 6-phosphate synthase